MVHRSSQPVDVQTSAASLVEVLHARASSQGHRTAFRFIGGNREVALTFAALDREAIAIASHLVQKCQPGDRVILLFPPCLDYISAFMACLYAGVVAVPLYPPRPNQKRYRAGKVIADCGATLALTNRESLPTIEAFLKGSASGKPIELLASDALPKREAADLPAITADQLAFLQYTSGSTGSPKGVMVRHGNIMANAQTMMTAGKVSAEDVFVSWLPMYHDMGLIGMVLEAIYGGFTTVLMPSSDFVRDPIAWLDAITRFKATISGGPNFGFELCCERITPERLAKLDLSTWRLAFNGAEPVRAETLARFGRAFAQAGFCSRAFFPCYGMAETTLFITGKPTEQAPTLRHFDQAALGENLAVPMAPDEPDATALVGCGQTCLEDRVLIIDPDGHALGTGKVGEIWVASTGTAKGYWRQSEASKRTFQARLANGDGPFLRTGDLGFLDEGELFITGRLKDLLIFNGRNYYPQDLERAAERAHSALTANACAAFSIDHEGRERLVLVAEVNRGAVRSLDADEVIGAIRAHLESHFELSTHEVVLLKPGRSLKTSSGKIQRRASKAAYLDGSLVALERSGPPETAAQALPDRMTLLRQPDALTMMRGAIHQLVASALAVKPDAMADDQPLVQLGMSSMAAIGVQHQLEKAWGIQLPLSVFLTGETIAQVAQTCLRILHDRTALKDIPAPAPQRFPLAPNQKTLWHFQQLAPASPAYNLAHAVRIRTALDLPAFKAALTLLIDRHAVLRAVVAKGEAGPEMVVGDHLDLPLTEVDARTWTDEAIEAHIQQSARQPFDLARGPLIRFELLDCGPQGRVLLLNMAHIAGDMWSLLVLLEELHTLYNARGAELLLAPPTVGYAHHASQRLAHVDTDTGQADLAFWRDKLAGEQPVLDLPCDRERPLHQTTHGAVLHFSLDEALSKRMGTLARQTGITKASLLLAAYRILLHRFANQPRILIGLPYHGRTSAAFDQVVGYFINPLPFVSDFDGTLHCQDFLEATQTQVNQATLHAGLPFQSLLEHLDIQRDPARAPLFQTMFAFQEPHQIRGAGAMALGLAGHKLVLGELDMETMAVDLGTAQFDLTLFVAEENGRFHVKFEFNRDLFQAQTIARFAEHWQALLAAMTKAPPSQIHGLAPISDPEVGTLAKFSQTQAPFPDQNPVPLQVLAVAKTQPEAPAVIEDGRHTSYGELAARSSALAEALVQFGIGRDTIVGICLPRSTELVAAALAVQLAGGAYLPMDPSYPDERLSHMANESRMALLLTGEAMTARFEDCDCPAWSLDRMDLAPSEAFQPAAIDPNQAAYLIYTSGSTGVPKGVTVPHRGLAGLVAWHLDAFALGADDHTGLTASPGFDASVWELWPSLCAGAAIHILPEALSTDPGGLHRWLGRESITVTFLATPLAEAVLPLDWSGHLRLRVLLTGGDKLHAHKVSDLPFSLINNYGPTENAVVATSILVRDGKSAPPIGRPIAGVEVQVLNRWLQPVPIGTPGELCLAGSQLARGYHRQPGATASAFVPNPMAKSSGASRLYRTGDLVRFDAEGRLHFLGRTDQQVKLRGYRIELGEIETALQALPGVRDALVQRDTESGDARLIAYLTGSPGTPTELRSALAMRLPAYMVPVAFVAVDSFPLTAHGKIDSAALPKPQRQHLAVASGATAPRTASESALAGIWAEVLNLAEVGIHDNFFELGGDSILAIQIMSRAQTQGLHFSPGELFQNPTVAGLAGVCRSQQRTVFGTKPPPGPVTPTPIQQWFLERRMPEPHHFNQSVLLEVEKGLEALSFEQALGTLHRHHDGLRLRFDLTGLEPIHHAEHGTPVFQEHRLGSGQAGDDEVLAITDALQRALNLKDGPLMACALMRTPDEAPDLFFITIHHLVVDGMSWRILLEDLALALRAVTHGEEIRLPAKTTSLSAWSRQLQAAKPDQSYWKEWPESLRPATMPAMAADKTATVEPCPITTLSRQLDTDLWQGLSQAPAKIYRLGVREVLLAALARTLAEATDRWDMAIDLEGHGRSQDLWPEIDLSRTVGWFTALFPVRLTLAKDSDAAEDLLAVKNQLAAIPHQGVFYNGTQSNAPASQVIFNYLGQFDGSLQAPFLGRSNLATGPDLSPLAPRTHLLEVNALVVDDRLEIHWTFPENQVDRARIGALLDAFETRIEQLVDHCRRQTQRRLTPGDFPLVQLGQQDLDKLCRTLGGIEDILPLTPVQEGMLFHAIYGEKKSAYFEQLICHFEGDLDDERFRQAWFDQVRATPALCTCFAWESQAAPIQIVLSNAEPEWRSVDLRDKDATTTESDIEAFLAADRERGFALDKAPLARFAVFRIGQARWRFVWSYHHLLLDGWSMALVLEEVLQQYLQATVGKPFARPSRPSLAAMAEAARQVHDVDARNYWREALKGYTAPLSLPFQRKGEGYQVRHLDFALPASAYLGLSGLAKSHGITLSTCVQAAWSLLLSRYCRTEDVVFGLTVSGRESGRPGITEAIGLLINTIPSRIQVAPDMPVAKWLEAIQSQALAREPFSGESLGKIQTASELEGGQELFDSLLVVENYPLDAARLQEGLNFRVTATQAAAFTHYALTMVARTHDGLSFQIAYDAARLPAAAIERMAGHLTTVLEALPAALAQPLGHLPMLTQAEQASLIQSGAVAAPTTIEASGIHQLFERQAARDPHRQALFLPAHQRLDGSTVPASQMSYGELDQAANLVAGELIGLGLGAESLVGLCVERSLDMVVGILGILKAGAAYVPLDPAYPQDRLAIITADAGLDWVLCQPATRNTLPEGNYRCLDIEAILAKPERENQPPRPDILPDQTAYVIYTSGSTGKPKGVPVSHANVVRLFGTCQSLFQFDEGDCWSLFHSYAFDFTVWELWGALIHGGKLVIVPQWVARSAEAFHQLLSEQQVTVLNQTPSAFVRLIEADERASASLTSLRYVIFGGEALEPRALRPWFEAYGEDRPALVNMYGITETTVHVTFAPVRQSACQFAGGSLGRPLPDLSLFLLDEAMNLVPNGVSGEIFVGSAGVARGYLKRPALTARRFVPDPFSNKPGGRLYRSGDLGRFDELRDPPAIEYTGRCDFQVKLRGYRIELGDIEAALTAMAGVRQAVVLAREDLPGISGKQLVAYLAGNADLIGQAGELHDGLARRLPDYMVPSHFVVLDALPMTAHGKIDRGKLPLPTIAQGENDDDLVLPRNDVERRLAAIWAEALQRDVVGIRQRFFELGGDSILSIRVMTAAKKQGLSFTLPQLFQHQTIENLAKVVETTGETSITQIPPFAMLGERDRVLVGDHLEDVYPATRLQKGMLFHAEEDAGAYHNLSSFHLRAPYDEALLSEAIAATIAGHPALRTAFDLGHFSEPMQLVHKTMAAPLVFEDWRRRDPNTQALALKAFFEAEKHAVFDSSEPGLLRFHIHRRNDDSFQFSLTEHHAILDGWSVASLLSEIFQRYFHLLNPGTNPAVRQPVSHFRNFVHLEREAIAGEASARFWADQLEGFEFTRIPRLHIREHGPVHLDVPLDGEMSQALLALANRWGVPLKSVLLAVHLRVLALISGSADILTGLVANGRPEGEDSERVLGLYLNTLPLRFRLGDSTWMALTQDVFEWERQALPHRRYPLADIQKMFGGKPLFETAFNYTHFHIYDAMSGVAGLAVLDTYFSAPTHLAFAANFSRDLASGRLLLSLDYRSETIPNRQAQAIGGYYRRALEALVGSPEGSCQKVAFLTGETRRLVLRDWNQTAVTHPQATGLHELVARQAARTPAKTAICQVTPGLADRTMSYGQMEEAANRLSHFLLANGARPDRPVAFCMERGPEAIVAMLAILKAGCGYLPLDPAYPDDRLGYMIADSGADLVCCFGIEDRRIEPFAKVIELERDRASIDACPTHPPAVAIHPEAMAYIIYTSGSTGTPKGVVISHRAILNQIHWRQLSFPLTGEDRLLQNLSLSFDPSVWQVFWPLSLGGELVLIPNDAQRDIPWLAHLLLERRIAATAMVPSVLRVLLSQADFLACDHLKHISCGGEGLPADLVTRFCEHFGEDGILHVVYGPTEATIDASTWHARLPVPTRIAPIGLPVHNARLYVLDAYMAPVPPGVPGELYIGGTGLGRGYLNRPGLTAERYVPNPFEPGGERLYRSGDVVRYLDDGLLEFRGRVDHQVKVRGFRIELGEIESILAQHPQINEVVCIVREDEPGEKRLVAYLTQTGDTALNLRPWLSKRMPDYMIPAVFARLDAFPRLPNDKIDRGQLPEPVAADRRANREWVAPRNDIETRLAEIWGGVLGLEAVGVTENFFELGGDSILSLQIIARAREAGLALSAKDLFQHQTIEALALNVGKGHIVEAEQGPVTGDVPLTPVQRWFFEGEASNHFNQALLLDIPAEASNKRLQSALNAVCNHHDALRLAFRHAPGGGVVQTFSPSDLEVPFEWIASSLDRDAWQASIAHKADKVHASFDLAEPPLFRAVCFRNTSPDGAVCQRLLLVAHHLVVDGVSWRFIAEDLQSAYLQIAQGKPVSLPAKTSSFKAWSAALADSAASVKVLEEKDYWLSQQEPATPLMDRPEGTAADTVANAETTSLQLDKAMTSKLVREVPAAYQTQIDDVLLTALALAWQHWAPDADLVLDLESHGRDSRNDAVDVTRTVGWFTAAYPVRLALNTSNPGTALKSVKQRLREVPSQGLGYGLLRYLNPQTGEVFRKLPAAPVSFNYLGQLDTQTQASPFRLADEATGQAHDPTMARRYLLEFNAFVKSGQLQTNLTWPPSLFEPGRIDALSSALIDALEALIRHCTETGAGGRIPSDYPLANADQATVDALVGNGSKVEDLFPLAPSQQDILFHVTLQQSSLFHQQLHFAIEEDLDVALFQAAWQETVRRHAALRASFHWESLATPLQRIQIEAALPWQVADWRNLDEAAQGLALTDYLKVDRARPFVLDLAPLMRFGLFRTGQTRYRFVWSHHHLLSDGWSLPLILGDVLALYQNPGTPLPKPKSFSHFLAWLDARDGDADRQWWRDQLRGFNEPTPLPLDQLIQPEAVEESHGKVGFKLNGKATGQLVEFARKHRLTVNTLVQGAWALLLGRYSRRDDVVFGTSVSGRPADLPGVESIVGLFINTLPVRASIDGQKPLLDWLAELQGAQQERETRSGTPASVIREQSEVSGDQPLYESILVFENYPIDQALQEHAMPITELEVAEQTNFPLTLTMAMKDGGFDVSLTYHTQRFDEDLANRILGHFGNLLDHFQHASSARLMDVDMLTEAETAALVAHGARRTLPEDQRCFHQLFEASASKYPHAIAAIAVSEDGAPGMTYAELDRRANALAHLLIQMGIARETCVGIYLDKCLDLPVAVLGVLKAGGTYVPLDPDYPRERLADMAEQADLSLILTRRDLQPSLPSAAIPAINLDNIDLTQRCAPPDRKVDPDQAAYLIFSSGSTGRPKGITVSHRSLVNAASAWEAEYRLRGTCKVHLQLAAFSFDVFAGDLARALTSGAALVLCPKALALEPARMWELMMTHSVDAVEFVPALVRSFCEYLESQGHRLDKLRLLAVGSDTWSLGEMARVKALCGPDTRLVTSYGLTEATIDSTYFESTELALPPERTVPIGKAFPNTRTYILDEVLQPQAVGVVGMLYIGGPALARHYHRQPGLTAKAFIPDPFGAEGGRLYRTGDAARLLPDGHIDFLGRLDQQVKIRGFRIELGEIEAVLKTQAGVQHAVVLARQDAPQALGPQLVAYLVGDPGLDASAIRNRARQQLPNYMVPAHIVILPEFPLTPNGKVDRRNLPAPDWQSFDGGRTESDSATEALLARIWSDVLQIENPGMEANFFDLGGHSLIATRLVSKIISETGKDLPLRDLFEHPTIAQLAEVLDAQTTQASEVKLVAVDQPPILSHGQERLWFVDQISGPSSAYNLGFALRLRGDLDPAALEIALGAILHRHDSLRSHFLETNGKPILTIDDPAPFTLPQIDLAHLTDAATAADQRFQALADEPFDLARDLLLRAVLMRLGPDVHLLAVVMHHIVSDAWSIGVMVRELSSSYRAALAKNTPQFPPLAIQYTDYAHWRRRFLESGQFDRQLAWWLDHLDGAPPTIELPFDRPRTAIRGTANGSIHFELGAELTLAVQRLAKATNTTLFMNLLGAYAVLLGRYSQSRDLVIGTPIANRTRTELEPLIGFFVNTLALRMQLGNDSWREHLTRIRELTLAAYAHQDLPFERLVDAMNVSRELSHEPVFQVMFTLQNAFSTPLDLPGLEVSATMPTAQTSRFDLLLVLEEVDGRLKGIWEYNADLFDRDTIVRMGHHFRHLLAELTHHPDRPIGGASLVGSGQTAEMVARFHAELAAEPPALTVQGMVEAQTLRTPDYPALQSPSTILSFSQLNQLASRLAHHLIRQGIGLETAVGIAAVRSPETIIGMLAILKAGGCYVPLDPNLPDQRLAYMISETGMAAILCKSDMNQAFKNFGLPIHNLDKNRVWPQEDHNPDRDVPANAAAYVMYTSGSTGTPKGTVIPQQAVVRLIAAQNYVALDEDCGVLHCASPAFDAATFEIWAPLAAGSRCCIFPQVAIDPEGLADYIHQNHADTMFLTSGLFNQITAHGLDKLQGVRNMMTGGDAISPSHAARYLEAVPHGVLGNLYGPTENTTFSTFKHLTRQDVTGRVPIGRSIRHSAALVLDQNFQPAPTGGMGRLYVAGPGLSRGYLNQPRLTARVFLPNPYATQPGDRIYDTGDLVFLNAEADLIFCGRSDDQVKIRGFRIELGDIEACLLDHQHIRQAAVLLREDLPGGKGLVAFIQPAGTADAGKLLDATQLAQFIRQSLPDYMVPAAFMLLETLPLNRNGKLDRHALLALPISQRVMGAAEQVPPRNEIEAQLAAIWTEVLDLEKVGVYDNFFDIGGHSLLATQILSRMKENFPEQLSLQYLFEQPTIAGIAHAIESIRKTTAQREVGDDEDRQEFEF